jgi:hypothetical protein
MPKRFEYYTDDNDRPYFQCQLEKLRCEHINPISGHHCRRRQIIGAGFCWKHLETDRHLKIKSSTIPDGGMGLFAYSGTNDNSIVFRGPRRTRYGQTRGDFIIEYTGETLPRAEIDRRYGGDEYTAPYGADINQRFVEDSACLRSAGSLANHKAHNRANARLVSNGRTIRIEATRNIRNGAEIFYDYGDEYQFEGYSHRTRNVR